MNAAGFLQFCMRVYSMPGVRESCLTLQDKHGVNVNCLLLAVWASGSSLHLDAAAWARLLEISSPVREKAVRPLRALRRQIAAETSLDPELRSPLKRLLLYAELRAEQAEERLLFDAARRLARPVIPAGLALLQENLAALAPDTPLDAFERFLAAVRDAVEQKVLLA